MITCFLFGGLACFCNLWHLSTTALVKIIIGMRLCISLFFYCKFGSVLALMWVLVYLGGMMVCFVYVLFIISSDSKLHQKTGGPTTTGRFAVVFSLSILALKVLRIKSWNLHALHFIRWRSNTILFREMYSQIISQSLIFFFISSIILLYALLQVLSMLNLKNKPRSHHLL